MPDEELLRASDDLRLALGRLVRLDRDGPATPGCLAASERVNR